MTCAGRPRAICDGNGITFNQKARKIALPAGRPSRVLHNQTRDRRQALQARGGGSLRSGVRLREGVGERPAIAYSQSPGVRRLPFSGDDARWLCVPPALSALAGNDRPMRKREQFVVPQLRRPRDYGLRSVDRRGRDVDGLRMLRFRHGSARPGRYNRAGEQQRPIFSAELLLAKPQGPKSEQAFRSAHRVSWGGATRFCLGRSARYSVFYTHAAAKPRVERGRLSNPTAQEPKE